MRRDRHPVRDGHPGNNESKNAVVVAVVWHVGSTSASCRGGIICLLVRAEALSVCWYLDQLLTVLF